MPGYDQAVETLDLTRGDTSGMWMLNYPRFPDLAGGNRALHAGPRAEESAGCQPRPAYRALPDYQPFSAAAARARAESLRELAGIDRVDPRWKLDYFEHLLSLDTEFARLR